MKLKLMQLKQDHGSHLSLCKPTLHVLMLHFVPSSVASDPCDLLMAVSGVYTPKSMCSSKKQHCQHDMAFEGLQASVPSAQRIAGRQPYNLTSSAANQCVQRTK